MPVATITDTGQTTVSQEIRDFLKLKPGDMIDFIIQEDGRVIIQPTAVKVEDLKGILHRQGMEPVSIEAMNAAVRKGRYSNL